MEIKDYILKRKEELKSEVANFSLKPHLVIVQVNDDPASNAYIRGKCNDGNELGIKMTHIKLDENITEDKLLEQIEALNNDNDVHGLIVQMPLPKHINEETIKLAVNPKKDVDGFHPLSTFNPCTPYGIIKYLKYVGFEFTGKDAVVIGRSNIVGKPMAMLLLNENCTVSIVHSRTPKSRQIEYVKNADLVVIAVGRKEFLNNDFEFKKDAVIVDVGINRFEGKLYGDALAGLPVALQTPVPGGVGLLTRLTLIDNLMEAYKNEI